MTRFRVWICAKNQYRNELQSVFFLFFFFKLSKKNIYLFFFFMVMVNLGSTDDSRYTGYREITDRDVLDLQCTSIFQSILLTLPVCNKNCKKAGLQVCLSFIVFCSAVLFDLVRFCINSMANLHTATLQTLLVIISFLANTGRTLLLNTCNLARNKDPKDLLH